jgi:hypothetical protein
VVASSYSDGGHDARTDQEKRAEHDGQQAAAAATYQEKGWDATDNRQQQPQIVMPATLTPTKQVRHLPLSSNM